MSKRNRQSNTKSFSKKSNSKINFNLKHDEEISSDESGEEKMIPNLSESEEEIETAEEKRRRMAKKYLDEMSRLESDKETNDEDEESDEEAHNYISENLKKNRLMKSGLYFREFSDYFSQLDFSDLSTSHYYGHNGPLTSLALTQDQTTAYTGSKDNSVIRWDIETGEKIILKNKWNRQSDSLTPAHEGIILSVAVSSDGKYIAAGSIDSNIYIYDQRQKYSEVHTFTGHRGGVTDLAFQSDSYSLFSVSTDRCLRYWDLNEMAYIESTFGHQEEIYAIDCWNKPKPITGSSDRSARLWKIEEKSHLVYRGSKSPIDAIKYITLDHFITGSQDGKLSYWDISRKNPSSSIQAAHGYDNGTTIPRWITSLSTIRSSDVFASGSFDGFVRLWSTKNNSISSLGEIPVKGFVNGLALTPKMIVAACGREHKLGRWWNIKGARDRLTVIRFPTDLNDYFEQDDENDSESDSDDDGIDDYISYSSDSGSSEEDSD